MKDLISNSSSWDSIRSRDYQFKRLYVVTGKGGVGKTCVSLALTNLLKKLGKRVVYLSFNDHPNKSLIQELDIAYHYFNSYESAEIYMGMKLNSPFIASWIIKAPFFKSAFELVPGISHLIFMGHTLDMLKKDPELIFVVDSPSSGHAITMFESSHNFGKIFKSGILFEDIENMHAMLDQENFLKTIILEHPTMLALQEGAELSEELGSYCRDVSMVVNDSLSEALAEHEESLPMFLEKKIEMERHALSHFNKKLLATIPHLPETSAQGLIQHMSLTVADLV